MSNSQYSPLLSVMNSRSELISSAKHHSVISRCLPSASGIDWRYSLSYLPMFTREHQRHVLAIAIRPETCANRQFSIFFFSSYYNSPAQFCKLSLNAVRNRRGIFDLSFSRAFVAIGRAYSSFAAGVETVWKIHTVCTKNFSPRDCQAAKRIFSRLVSLEIGCIAWICAVVLDILQHGRRLSRDSKTWSVNVRDYLFNDSPTRARAQFANLFHIRDYL